MFGRLGWMEILVIVILVLILFGHNKIPGMMKNLADGVNIFKKELKDAKKEEGTSEKKQIAAPTVKPAAKKSAAAKKTSAKKSTQKKAPVKKTIKK